VVAVKLMGNYEVAVRLGVTKQRVHQLRSTRNFPKPIEVLACGPVWRAMDIESFARTWTRRPGPPSKQHQ